MGWVTCSSFSMRSSYSTPSCFISATSSDLALLIWALRMAAGFSRMASTRERTFRTYFGSCLSSSGMASRR